MATDSIIRRRCVAFLVAACAAAGPAYGADPAQRQAVDTVRPLLMQAVAGGSAHGVLVGATAIGFAEAFGSTAPIEVDVRRLRLLAQQGCARLHVETRQTGIHVASAPSLAPDQALAYEISFCQDGTFPGEVKATR